MYEEVLMKKSFKDIRADFPMLDEQNIAYLDSAASSQKPLSVIKRIEDYYRNENANIHRGVYSLSETATRNYETARMNIAKYIGVDSEEELKKGPSKLHPAISKEIDVALEIDSSPYADFALTEQ